MINATDAQWSATTDEDGYVYLHHADPDMPDLMLVQAVGPRGGSFGPDKGTTAYIRSDSDDPTKRILADSLNIDRAVRVHAALGRLIALTGIRLQMPPEAAGW